MRARTLYPSRKAECLCASRFVSSRRIPLRLVPALLTIRLGTWRRVHPSIGFALLRLAPKQGPQPSPAGFIRFLSRSARDVVYSQSTGILLSVLSNPADQRTGKVLRVQRISIPGTRGAPFMRNYIARTQAGWCLAASRRHRHLISSSRVRLSRGNVFARRLPDAKTHWNFWSPRS